MGNLSVATCKVTTSNAPVADRNGDFQAFLRSFEIASKNMFFLDNIAFMCYFLQVGIFNHLTGKL